MSTRTAPRHPEAEQLLIKGIFHISNGYTVTELQRDISNLKSQSADVNMKKRSKSSGAFAFVG